MSKSSHAGTGDQPENQNNAMSNDPADGGRKAFKTGRDGVTPVEKSPEQEGQEESAVEAFGEEGAGVAAKE